MMIMLDYKDTRPIYEQVVEKFQTLILKGVLEPDAQLPSVRSLAVELSINPNTIQRAYGELERQGFIYTIKGRGGFVRYSEGLLEIRKERLREQLAEVMKEARELVISMQELLAQCEEKMLVIAGKNTHHMWTGKDGRRLDKA